MPEKQNGEIISRKTPRLDIRISSRKLEKAGLDSVLDFEAIPDPENRRIILIPATSEKTRWPGVRKIVISGLPEGAIIETKKSVFGRPRKQT